MAQRSDSREMKLILKRLIAEIPETKGCDGCGKCCGPTFLSTVEMAKICNHIEKMGLWNEVISNLDARAVTEDVDEMVTCPLLRKEENGTKCLVYPVRPIVCRLYGSLKDDTFQCSKVKPTWNGSKWLERYYALMYQHRLTMVDGLVRAKTYLTYERPPNSQQR